MTPGKRRVIDRIHIELSPDEMQARLRIEVGAPMGADELRAALLAARVSAGIDEAMLARLAGLVADGAFTCEPVVIATGRPMQRESNGACVFAVPIGLQPGHELDDGSFDYRDRGLLTPVKRGQLIAHCDPPIAGVDGQTVTGRVLRFERAATGRAPSFGAGLSRSRGGDVVAEHDGVVHEGDAAAIEVDDHYAHEGDVDLHSGHLDMHGGLTVTGDVTAKFEASASGDVRIDKSVARGSVYSGSNLAVRGGILGATGASVMAEGDVAAEHAQGAVIRCGGTLHLRRAAINCDLHGRVVRIDGVARGGWIHAERGIVVGDAGSASGAETLLVVGVAVARPLRRQFDEQRREQHAADRLGAHVAHAHVEESLSDAADVEVGPSRPHVDVVGTVHAGTTVVLGAHRLTVDRAHRRVRFSIDPDTHAIRIDPMPQGRGASP